MAATQTALPPIVVDDRPARLDDVVDVATLGRKVALSGDAAWVDRVRSSRAALERALASGVPVYGVSTKVGYESSRRVEADALDSFSYSIMRQHGCGVGEPLSREETRAVVFARLISLAKAYSAVRLDLLAALAELLNRGVTPIIPRFGSVGASGDLTPLSYVAAVLAGEREAWLGDEELDAADALRRAGLRPFRFMPKEVLAIMNGTSVMVGVAVLTLRRLRNLVVLTERASAVACELLYGRSQAFHPTAHQVKPHPGQVASAAAVRRHLAGSGLVDTARPGERIIQDPYSIRCVPQVVGAARDALDWVGEVLVRELNSVNDNPIVDPKNGELIFAGNFFGGHVALAMDMAKLVGASLADLADRQFALLVDSRFNEGLPETLVTYGGSGLKALQITCSALAARAVQGSTPDSVLSRPTEVNNQDKVSMGLNAAVHAAGVVETAELAVATELVALSGAAVVRGDAGLSPAAHALLGEVRRLSPPLSEDRRLDRDLARLVAWIRDPTSNIGSYRE